MERAVDMLKYIHIDRALLHCELDLQVKLRIKLVSPSKLEKGAIESTAFPHVFQRGLKMRATPGAARLPSHK